jgi:hypothetical protein
VDVDFGAMKEPKTEQFLTHGAWKWVYQTRVLFSDIDRKASRENPSRLLARVDEERVQSYGLAMEAGVEFPAIVLLSLDPAVSAFKYLIATGVHRVEAADLAGLKEFDAYVIAEPDQYRAELLVRQLNTIEGHGVSIRDRVQQILHLHETYPDQSLKSLSKEWSIKYSTVQAAFRERQAIARARRFGVEFTKSSKLSQKSLLAMNTVHSDPVFQKILQFVSWNNVPASEIEDIVKEIKQTRDDNAAMGVVERHMEGATERKLQAQAKHGRITPAAATKFMADARRLMNDLDKGIEALHLGAYPRRDLARRLAEDLIDSLKRVVADINRIERITPAPRETKAEPAMAGLH